MDDTSQALITIGVLLLLGLVADFFAKRTKLPRVTLLMVMGLIAGPSVLDALPENREVWFPLAADIALVMIGLLLGAEFTKQRLKGQGIGLFSLALMQALFAAAAVGIVLVLFDVETEIALLLAGIATATAPAATVAVVKELKSRGNLTDTLLRVVAIDDLFALVLFSVLAAAAGVVSGTGSSGELIGDAAIEIGGAIGLGIAIGVPAGLLTGRIKPGEATLLEGLGIVLLSVGLATWLGLSPLLLAVVTGITVANLAKHHTRTFREIENIEWPFLVLFFVLAGASLETESLENIGWIGAGYVLLRTAGKLLGAYVGGRLFHFPETTNRWLGMALLPHAGVALGLALIAAEQFPEFGEDILSVTVVATVVFELIGPLATRLAVTRAGEVPHGNDPAEPDDIQLETPSAE